jgi:hypothetical protein
MFGGGLGVEGSEDVHRHRGRTGEYEKKGEEKEED